MKIKLFNVLIICFAFIQASSQDATVIYKNTVNSVVTIETDLGLGSGFFVGDGIIATNYHVIKGASKAWCYSGKTTGYKFDIAGYLAVDSVNDLILLKINVLNRTPIKFSTTPVVIGQKVYVIGSPKGLEKTISDGIVSSLRDFDGYKLIQITAAISPGSSGGPVLNSKGELIGISVGQYRDGQNLNFAIPKASLKILLLTKNDTAAPLPSLNSSALPDNPNDLQGENVFFKIYQKYFKAGGAYRDAGDYENAIVYFDSALKCANIWAYLYPNDTIISTTFITLDYSLIAHCYLGEKNFNQAMAYTQKEFDMYIKYLDFKGAGEALFEVAKIRIWMIPDDAAYDEVKAKTQETIADCDQAISYETDKSYTTMAEIYNYLAKCYRVVLDESSAKSCDEKAQEYYYKGINEPHTK